MCPESTTTCLRCGVQALPGKRHCSNACYLKGPRRPLTERFWSKVNKDGPLILDTPCWLWTAACDTTGYATLRVDGKLIRAARIGLSLAGKIIPEGEMILHRCDNPPCVNPDHLFFGDHAANAADMVAKGRSATGDRSTSRLYPELRPRGERHPHAKLTWELVEEIRRLSQRGGSQRQIAHALGINRNSVKAILEGRTWRRR